MNMDNKFKYDVFVSYSRKDYVDSYENIIEGSPVKSIIDLLRCSRARVIVEFGNSSLIA